MASETTDVETQRFAVFRSRAAWVASLPLARVLPLVAFVSSSVLTFAVYWRVLGYSFFLDDAYDLTRTQQESYWALLSRPLSGYGYYRPMSFIISKAVYDLTGRYDTTLLHLLPLLAHAVSGWLLFMVLWRLTRSPWSLVPSALFLLYPFSYQALVILGAMVHVLVTAEILAVLLLWYDGRTLGSPVRLLLASVLSGMALWTHEYGVVVLPLLVGIEVLIWWRQRRISRPTLWLVIPTMLEALYLYLWFTMKKPGAAHRTLGDVIHNVGIWLQGFAYPATRQTYWLTHLFGGDPVRLVLPLGALAVIVGAALFVLNKRPWTPLLAVSIGGMVFTPAVVGLTYAYVLDSPRLLYVVAPACAVFWGLLPSLRFRRQWLTWAWRVGTLLLTGVVLVQSVLFIDRRLTMLDYGTQIANGIIHEGELHPNGKLLFMNVPSWFAPKTQEFPRGHLGVQIEPSYTGLSRLIYAGSGLNVTAESYSLAPDVSGWLYNFQPHGQPIDHKAIDAKLRAGMTLVVVDLYHHALAVREPGSLTLNQPNPGGAKATVGGRLDYLGDTITRTGNLVTITSRWYVRASLNGDYQIWTELRDANGKVVAQRKDYALRGMSPPSLWKPGDLIVDRLVLDLSQNPSAGQLQARLGVVSTANGSMLPVTLAGQLPNHGGWLALGRVPQAK